MHTRSIMVRYPGKGWRRILVVVSRSPRRLSNGKRRAQRRYAGRLGLWTFQAMREAAE